MTEKPKRPVRGMAITTFAHRPKTQKTPALSDKWTTMENFDVSIPILRDNIISDDVVIGHARMLLWMLNYYVRCFEADVQLYEESAFRNDHARHAFEKNDNDDDANNVLEILDGWVVIAARDGAMSLFHFRQILDQLDGDRFRDINKLVNTTTKRLAKRSFDAAFPNFREVRHAVGHSGERHNENHATTINWGNGQVSFTGGGHTYLVDVISQRQYSNTWQGKVVSYEISLRSLRKLAAIRDRIFQAYQSLV